MRMYPIIIPNCPSNLEHFWSQSKLRTNTFRTDCNKDRSGQRYDISGNNDRTILVHSRVSLFKVIKFQPLNYIYVYEVNHY